MAPGNKVSPYRKNEEFFVRDLYTIGKCQGKINLLLEFSTRTNIFILGKDPIQGSDDTTLTADA